MQTKPKLLVPDVLWHVGNPVIGERRCGLFFARRMGFNPGFDQVVDALRDRTGEPPGVILTTSRWNIRNVTFPGNHQIMKLRDFLPGSDDAVVRIDMEAVSRLITGIRHRRWNRPLQYSNDYSSVTVNGRTFVFRGDKQKQVVGALIDAWELGDSKLRASDVLSTAESNAPQIAKLFHRHPDWKELIGYGDGFCWLRI